MVTQVEKDMPDLDYIKVMDVPFISVSITLANPKSVIFATPWFRRILAGLISR